MDDVCVSVELMNDAGDVTYRCGFGETADEAVADAEARERTVTGDETWTMSEWRAA